MIAGPGSEWTLFAGRDVDQPDRRARPIGHDVGGAADVGDRAPVGADLRVRRGAEIEQVAPGESWVWSVSDFRRRRCGEAGGGEQNGEPKRADACHEYSSSAEC